jgi:nitrogen regulatory protein PII
MLVRTCAPLEFVMAVVPRGDGEQLSRLFSEGGALMTVMTLGRGTASRRMLSYLGLGETLRDVLYSVMPRDAAPAVLERLSGEMNLGEPGSGIAFSVPLGAAGRARAEESTMEFGLDLVLAVVNQGYADEAMEAARLAGATGGTVIHARGVGMKQAEKFFGVSVQAEKEVLFTVVPGKLRQAVMDAIASKAGPGTDAGAVVFSLPVDEARGLEPGAQR